MLSRVVIKRGSAFRNNSWFFLDSNTSAFVIIICSILPIEENIIIIYLTSRRMRKSRLWQPMVSTHVLHGRPIDMSRHLPGWFVRSVELKTLPNWRRSMLWMPSIIINQKKSNTNKSIKPFENSSTLENSQVASRKNVRNLWMRRVWPLWRILDGSEPNSVLPRRHSYAPQPLLYPYYTRV